MGKIFPCTQNVPEPFLYPQFFGPFYDPSGFLGDILGAEKNKEGKNNSEPF
jgi:hypothetical protein